MSPPNVTQGAELYPSPPLSAVKIRVIREIRAKKIASEAEKDGSIDLLSDDTLKRLSSTH